MADEVRVWGVGQNDSLVEIAPSKLGREQRIENWIVKDIAVLEPGKSTLLIIGEQVLTDYGKKIDLLCMDSKGDLVIVELKRDLTPREVTAQALDYASWVKDLGAKEIERIAAEYFQNGKTLSEAFNERFGDELPDEINEDHSIRIVASEIDDSTERIIRYLSGRGVNINAVRFQMFRAEDSRELLVRTFTVPPDEAEQNIGRSVKSKRTSSRQTLLERLEHCANAAEIDFINKQLESGREMNNRKTHLAFRVAGKIRWHLRCRDDHATIIQKGRFDGDDKLWTEELSAAHLGFRRQNIDLSFYLVTAKDFEFFQSMLDNPNLDWTEVNQVDAEREEEEGE